jgi:hypothetical protein
MNEHELCKLFWPEGSDDDESPLQDALEWRSRGDSGPLQELVDSGELTREERDRLTKIRNAWPRHLKGPLFNKRGRMRGERKERSPFVSYVIKLVKEARAERLAQYAKREPPQTTLLGPGELEGLTDWALGKAREKSIPEGINSEERIRELLSHPKRF